MPKDEKHKLHRDSFLQEQEKEKLIAQRKRARATLHRFFLTSILFIAVILIVLAILARL